MAALSTSASGRGWAGAPPPGPQRAVAARLPRLALGAAAGASVAEFHAPQVEQRPNHRGSSRPHEAQKNVALVALVVFATAAPRRPTSSDISWDSP